MFNSLSAVAFTFCKLFILQVCRPLIVIWFLLWFLQPVSLAGKTFILLHLFWRESILNNEHPSTNMLMFHSNLAEVTLWPCLLRFVCFFSPSGDWRCCCRASLRHATQSAEKNLRRRTKHVLSCHFSFCTNFPFCLPSQLLCQGGPSETGAKPHSAHEPHQHTSLICSHLSRAQPASLLTRETHTHCLSSTCAPVKCVNIPVLYSFLR